MAERREATQVTGEGVGGHWTDRCYALTGLVFCANCGSRMTAIPTKSRGKLYRRYLCQGWMKSRVCNPYHVNADRLEAAVAVRIRDHFGWGSVAAGEFRSRVVEALLAQSGDKKAPALAEGERARERAKLARQVEQSVGNLAFVPPEVAAKLGGHIAGWQARIAEIDREVAADAQRRLDQQSVESIADEVVALLGQVDQVIAGAPRDEVRAFFVRAVERIELRFTTAEVATKAAKGRPKAGSGAEQT